MDAGNTLAEIIEDVLLGETNDAPTETFESGIFLFVFELLEFGGVGFAVVAFNGEVSVVAENGKVEAISFTFIRKPILRNRGNAKPPQFPLDYLLGRSDMIELQDIVRGAKRLEVGESE